MVRISQDKSWAGKAAFVLACFLCITDAAGAAAKGIPAALITDIIGPIAPGFQPFDEVAIGTEINLADQAEISISHYKQCRDIRVRGGRLKVRSTGIKIIGSTVLSNVPRVCPKRIKLAEFNVVSAVVRLRNITSALKLTARPEIVFVGSNRKHFTSGAVFDLAGQRLAEMRFDGHRAHFSADAPALRSGVNYKLILKRADGSERSIPFVCSEAGGSVAILEP
jgi:hypothetical protein